MKHAVVLIADEYQDLEVWYPLLRLKEAGWKVTAAGTQDKKQYRGKNGYPIDVDAPVESIDAKDVDALVIPGGWAPDYIRRNANAVHLVQTLNTKGKIIASICHGGWVLCSAKILQGRKCTSFSAIKDDMVHAGAQWVDEEVVVDQNLITSRKPDDLPAFCKAILKAAIL